MAANVALKIKQLFLCEITFVVLFKAHPTTFYISALKASARPKCRDGTMCLIIPMYF